MIIGHQRIRERLARSVEKDNISQAYLFIGPESVGKFPVAKEFALKLIGSDGVAGNKNGQEVDLFVLEPERETEKGITKEKDISAEKSREARGWLGSFPYAGRKKVLIIRDAHRLTETAQNILLKILEEPPSYAVIILVTHEFGKILQTIVSRCQRVPFHLVDEREMSGVFASLPEKEKFLFSLGRPGLIIDRQQQEDAFLEMHGMLERLHRLPECSLRERIALAEALATDLPRTLRIMEWWISGLYATVKLSSDDILDQVYGCISRIVTLSNDLKRHPSSARLLLEHYLIQW